MAAASPEQDYQQIQIERQRLEDSDRRLQQDIDARVHAITAIRGDLEGKIGDLQVQSEELQRALRRAPYDDVVRYRIYQTAQMRMVGVLRQVIKRSKAADRVLEGARAEQEERVVRERQAEVREKVKAAQHSVAQLQQPQDDDFETLYEGVIDGP